MKITQQQRACIYAMMNKLHIKGETKEIITLGFTQQRTTHISEMTKTEAAALIQHLKDIDPEEQRANKMRRKIISMAHEMHWHNKYGKADIQRIDNWCKAYGYKHKSLNNYTYKELPALVTQFEQVYLSFLNHKN
ncbi:MAG: hypothetical protein EKK39_14815 [Sphingobacteriales bacterium]|nr:MAG: hypothetical protein EKK39_14815 [Sphingobacteriales bacterium]